MVSEGKAALRGLAVLLLLCCVISSQALQFLPGGHHDHHGAHCCCACNPGHFSAVPAAGRVIVAQAGLAGWHFEAEEPVQARDEAVLTASSRAPPA